MRTHLLALGLALVLDHPAMADDRPRPEQGPAQLATSPGIRTNRLSRRELNIWRSIVAIVMAEGPAGQPRHPTLRALWDEVVASGHTVYVTMGDRKGRHSYVAGRFTVTKVDPEGKAHEGVIVLNLPAVDQASTGPLTATANGFIRFEGLGRMQRYAEVLGHELAHAVWILADTERARLVEWLQGELERQPMMLVAARRRGLDAEIEMLENHVAELDRMSRALEGPAAAVERLIWQELRASAEP
jgi:hypothetical protein